jgi:multidrug efflux system membrane fusion protein
MKLLRSAVAVTIAAALLTGCPDIKQEGAGAAGGMPPVPVNTARAVRKDVPLEAETFGNAEPIASVAVKAQVPGELISVGFNEGQDVKKGDLLFTIQPKLYATRLAEANANLERDRALAENAVLNLKRQEALDAKGSGVKEELERARAQVAATAATVKADEALALIAETQHGYTTIESPMDGRAGSIRFRPGNLISAAAETPLTTIVQLSPIYVTFALPELHLAAIRRSMESGNDADRLTVIARDPNDERILGEGKLTFVANTVDPATATITLKATFDNQDRALWPGAFVDVSVRLSIDRDAVVVPASAITLGQRGPQIYVVKDDGAAELRQVTVSRTAGEESIIAKGVAAGETVVTNGQSRLLPGAKVIVKPDTPAADQRNGRASPAPADSSGPASAPAGKPAASGAATGTNQPPNDSTADSIRRHQ